MIFDNLLGKMAPVHRVDRRQFQAQRYAVQCLPTHEQQAVLLEVLRYKWRYKDSPLLAWRVMQRLGDVGRRVFFTPLPGVAMWW